jgi:AraC-like DNA-binding protein
LPNRLAFFSCLLHFGIGINLDCDYNSPNYDSLKGNIMGAFLERLLEPSSVTTPSQYVDMLLSVYPLFPEIIVDRLSQADPYTRLRFELKRRGITNKDLAEKSGIHETAIARAFSRKTGLDKHWDKIARAIQVERRWLADGLDDAIRNVNAWPSPLLGRLCADLTALLNQEPPFMTVSIAGFVEIDQDLPQFSFKKGDHLILARTKPGPKDMAIVRLNVSAGVKMR